MSVPPNGRVRTTDDIIAMIRSRVEGWRGCGKGWESRCPAHDDDVPSMTLAVGKGGRVLVKCHKGCGFSAIARALGMTKAEFYPSEGRPSNNGNGKPPWERTEKVYTYRYEDGSPAFECVRLRDPKDFRQKRPGKYAKWNIDGVRLVPYCLSELLAADPAETVYVPEGEKDVDNLRAFGFVATCNPMGAGKWRPEYSEHLRGRDVVILPDNDPAGMRHACDVARSLEGVARWVRVLELPGLPEKGDVSDWFADGGTAEELRELADEKALPAEEWLSLCNFAEAEEEVPAREDGGIKMPEVFTAEELLRMALPEPRWAVPQLLPEGLNLLAAKPKIGKSWLALNLSIAIATGGKALGMTDVICGDVLYIALEDTKRRLKDRLNKLRAACPGLSLERLTLTSEWPRQGLGGVECLAKWLSEHPDARLVVIDTWGRFRRPYLSRNSYQEDYEMAIEVKALADTHRVAILGNHHSRKGGAEDPLEEVSGTLGLTGCADTILVMRRDRGRYDACLHVTGRDVEENELALRWDKDSAWWKLAGNADDFRMSEERHEIFDLLKEEGKPMKPVAIARALGKKQATVRKLLKAMKDEGQVQKGREGYGLGAEGGNTGNASGNGNATTEEVQVCG